MIKHYFKWNREPMWLDILVAALFAALFATVVIVGIAISAGVAIAPLMPYVSIAPAFTLPLSLGSVVSHKLERSRTNG